MDAKRWRREISMSLHLVPANPYGFDGAGVLNVVERAGAEHEKICPLPFLQRAQILRAEEFGRVLRGHGDDLLRSETGVGHKLHFPLLEITLDAARRPGVCAESAFHSGI